MVLVYTIFAAIAIDCESEMRVQYVRGVQV